MTRVRGEVFVSYSKTIFLLEKIHDHDAPSVVVGANVNTRTAEIIIPDRRDNCTPMYPHLRSRNIVINRNCVISPQIYFTPRVCRHNTKPEIENRNSAILPSTSVTYPEHTIAQNSSNDPNQTRTILFLNHSKHHKMCPKPVKTCN